MIKKTDQLSEAIARFSAGNSADAYQFLGCHRQTVDSLPGMGAPRQERACAGPLQ